MRASLRQLFAQHHEDEKAKSTPAKNLGIFRKKKDLLFLRLDNIVDLSKGGPGA